MFGLMYWESVVYHMYYLLTYMVSRKILDQFFPESGGLTYMWVIIFFAS